MAVSEKKKKKFTKWEKQFKSAIECSEMSLVEIAKRSDVDYSQLSRFIGGERTITLPTAEKIAKVISLELKEVRK